MPEREEVGRNEPAIGQCGWCGAAFTADHVCGERLLAAMEKEFPLMRMLEPQPNHLAEILTVLKEMRELLKNA